MIRGHPYWASCPACGKFKSEGMPCHHCGYIGSPIPAGATLQLPIPEDMITASLSGTLTLSASSSMAVYGLFRIEENIVESELPPEEKIKYRSYLGLAQEILVTQSKNRKARFPEHKGQYREKIEEYRSLVEANEEEPTFQSFFENNPNFLIADQKISEAKPNYGGEFEPDFMIETSTAFHWIIEIEKPGKPLFRQNNQPYAEFTQAETQIRGYTQWARSNIQFLKERNWPRLTQEKMHGLLLIGNREGLNPAQKAALDSMNHDRRASYQIKTFDEILAENISRLENWERM